VISTIVEETFMVRVAAVDCPGLRSVPSLFHVRVIGPFEFAGLQLLVVMFKDSERPMLLFLIYIV